MDSSDAKFEPLPQQLQALIDDMNGAYAAGLYYPALLVSLTLPEVCASLAKDPHQFVRERDYALFVDTYSAPAELGLNGQACYRMRGGVVHRGNAAGHPFFGSSHVIFTVPELGSTLHALSINIADTGAKAAMFDLRRFCDAMTTATQRWYKDHAGSALVQAALPQLLRWRREGLSPYVVGIPVLASGA